MSKNFLRNLITGIQVVLLPGVLFVPVGTVFCGGAIYLLQKEKIRRAPEPAAFASVRNQQRRKIQNSLQIVFITLIVVTAFITGLSGLDTGNYSMTLKIALVVEAVAFAGLLFAFRRRES